MHEVEVIKHAGWETEPFDHLFMTDIFSPPIYKRILKYFPRFEQMQKSADYSYQIDILQDPGVAKAKDGKWLYDKHLDPEQIDFWNEFKEEYCGGKFLRALLKKFKLSHMEIRVACRLSAELQGAGLGPHTDRRDKLCSLVFYLDDNPDACGTHLLVPKDPNFQPGERHHGYKDFEIVKTLEYKKNSCIGWSVDAVQSLHSYYQDKPTVRRTIKYFILDKKLAEDAATRIQNTKTHAEEWREDVR